MNTPKPDYIQILRKHWKNILLNTGNFRNGFIERKIEFYT